MSHKALFKKYVICLILPINCTNTGSLLYTKNNVILGNDNNEIDADKKENKQSNGGENKQLSEKDNVDSVCSTSKSLEEGVNEECLEHKLSTNDLVQVKRSHSVDETEDVKKIKTEPEEVKVEPSDIKPGPSLDQVNIYFNV